MPLRARGNFVKTHGTNRIAEKQGGTNEYFRVGSKMRFFPEEKSASLLRSQKVDVKHIRSANTQISSNKRVY